MKNSSILLKISAVLWIIWGIVHVFAGVMIVSQGTAAAYKLIADAVNPALLDIAYPDAVGAILKQHGLNLFWIGLTTIIGGFYIWRQNVSAIFVSALVGGLADLGYFIFVDRGGYAHFIPGGTMTIVSAVAIILSLYVYFNSNKLQTM